jgi:cobaltochelatase CobS
MTQILNLQPDSASSTVMAAPDKTVDVRETFGIDIDMQVPAFSVADERVPDRDDSMSSIPTPRWRSLQALPSTAA